jgi:hypothetical protein
MKSKTIIPKGTSVCPSELGHNNFYYPKLNKCTILTDDIEVQQLAYAGGGNLTAYKVNGQNSIVWAQKKFIQEVNI